jgi:hypothetical protein
MDSSQAQGQCICPDCPTYFDCGEPLAFCLYEQCIRIERGCICPGCPVYVAGSMEFDLYCTRESERVQAGASGGGAQ